MTFDIEQAQRRDIETALERVGLGLDGANLSDNPYVYVPSSFVGNAWFQQGEKIVKLNVSEDEVLSFVVSALSVLRFKNVTNVIVGFDYEVSNVKVNYPTLVNVSFASADLTSYKSCETILTTQGHIEVDCSLFDFSADIVNNAINEQGFCIGLNFNSNKSNATVKISNVTFGFKYSNLLQDESESVVNRLEHRVDFYRKDYDLILEIGDGTGKGKHEDVEVDTYSKLEIDTFLNGKVDVVTGKGLSTNDYTTLEKQKLANVEEYANNYVHPSSHSSGIIVEESALSNLETDINATQHEINLAIDSKISGVGGSVSWSDVTDKPSSFPPSSHNHTKSEITDFPSIPSKTSDLSNDSGFIETSSTTGLIKNDGTIDTTSYYSNISVSTGVDTSNEVLYIDITLS